MARKLVMAEKPDKNAAKPQKAAAPDHLTMKLFAPGMSALHRAGLGGLACTLKAMERQFANGQLAKSKLPAPFIDGQPPWEIGEHSVTLKFGKPEQAGEYLRKLFEFAFQIDDGVIYLPGQYGEIPPPTHVRVAIQNGIQNTFLQHGPTCGSRSGERTVTVQIDDHPFSSTHDVFTSYKHQGWFWLDRDEKSKETDPTTGKKLKTGKRIQLAQGFPAVESDGTISRELHEIDNKLFPGGIVRHDRFRQSAVRETSAGLICLHFSLVGCLTLNVNRVTAVLLVPEVQNLLDFAAFRQWITPSTLRECQIANAADAAIQAQIRLHSHKLLVQSGIPSFSALTCRPTKWNEKQKPRVATLSVTAVSPPVLRRFERALACLPPRLVPPKAEQRGKRIAKASRSPTSFWADSIVRPLIAENLARGRPWYERFVGMLTKRNPATDKPFHDQLPAERKGLHDMIADDTMWDDEGETLVVKAVHEAVRQNLGRIKEETDGKGDRPPSQATKNRWNRFQERLRIDLAKAKRADDARHTLCDLFSRAGRIPVLIEGWRLVLPKLSPTRWRLTRDLALLALCSYEGQDRSTTDAHADEPTHT
ncbi:MAG: CRISPR-associated protein Cas8a1/Csx13 [Pirellulaceae bacterium]